MFGNLGAWALAAISLCWAPAAGLKGSACGIAVLLASFLAPLSDRFLQLHYSLDGTEYTTTRRAADCAFAGEGTWVLLAQRGKQAAQTAPAPPPPLPAGALISACANILLCLLLGYKDCPAGASNCCDKADQQEQAKPAPAATAITATDANAAAFIKKSEQAAAAMV